MAETTGSGGLRSSEASHTHWRLDFWLFAVMLVLAVLGVAVTQLDFGGIRLYWAALLLVYAAISLVRASLEAKRLHHPVWPMIRSQVLHWIGALVAIKIVILFEFYGATDRGPASDYSLLILALACYLAGVHFNWIFLPLGVILAAISVGLGFLDQLSVFAFLVPVGALALWIVFKRKWAPAS